MKKMAISNKKLLEAVETIGTFCEEQPCCQSCILPQLCADGWNCCMKLCIASELSEAMANEDG
jgi:hypothetical protein